MKYYVNYEVSSLEELNPKLVKQQQHVSNNYYYFTEG